MKTAKTSQMSPLVPQHKQMAQGKRDQVPCKSIPSAFGKGKKA